MVSDQTAVVRRCSKRDSVPPSVPVHWPSSSSPSLSLSQCRPILSSPCVVLGGVPCTGREAVDEDVETTCTESSPCAEYELDGVDA
jgi:hypothetical protein